VREICKRARPRYQRRPLRPHTFPACLPPPPCCACPSCPHSLSSFAPRSLSLAPLT
jgi:hypothetical protein